METIYKIRTIKVRLKVSAPSQGKRIDSDRAARLLRGIYRKLDADQEHFAILCLNGKNRMTGCKVLFSGGTNQTYVDPKIIFRTALLMGAVQLVVCHNHPSGDPKPSREDVELTTLLESVGKQLNLPVVDHIILGDRGAWSLAQSRALEDYFSRLTGRVKRPRSARTKHLRRKD